MTKGRIFAEHIPRRKMSTITFWQNITITKGAKDSKVHLADLADLADQRTLLPVRSKQKGNSNDDVNGDGDDQHQR